MHPGGDDVFALLWLASLALQGKVVIKAVTTAEGNVPASQTYANACRIIGAVGGLEGVPIGAGVPAVVGAKDDFHGSDGMGGHGALLPDPTGYASFDAAPRSDELIVSLVGAHAPGALTIIALGPLANLQSAEERAPGTLAKLREVVAMAGAFGVPGNITPHAEFNVLHNPTSYNFVMGHTDIVYLPLDVTNELVFDGDMAKRALAAVPRPGAGAGAAQLGTFLGALWDSQVAANLAFRQTRGKRGMLMHDSAAVAFLLYPQLLLAQRARVTVEEFGTATRGMTCIDGRVTASKRCNAWIVRQLDAKLLMTAFVEDMFQLFELNDSIAAAASSATTAAEAKSAEESIRL